MNQPITKRFDGTDATATDNVALVTISQLDARAYKKWMIQAVAGAVDVEASLDGVTFDGPLPLRSTSGAALASDEVNNAAAATSIGILEGVYDAIIVRKKGTTNPTTVIVMAGDPAAS